MVNRWLPDSFSVVKTEALHGLFYRRHWTYRREHEALDLLGEGKTTKEIAAVLKLSTATIGNYRKAFVVSKRFIVQQSSFVMPHSESDDGVIQRTAARSQNLTLSQIKKLAPIFEADPIPRCARLVG